MINDLTKLKDIYREKRAFVIGMGPSLKISDLELLKDEVCFACNKIFLAYKETSWRPSFYSVTDQVVAKNNIEAILNLSGEPHTKYLFPSTVEPHLKGFKSAYTTNHISRPLDPNGHMIHRFSTDISKCTYGGYTVLYYLLQAAFYTGVKDVYLIGVDFQFNTKTSKRSGDFIGPDEILISNGERNHFHKDYRAKGETWVAPFLDKQKKSFELAKQIFESNGRRIFNASRKSKLNVFPKVNLEEVL